MSAQAEQTGSISDIIKLVVCPILIVAGIVAFYQFSDFLLLYRVLGLVTIIVFAAVVFLTTTRGKGVAQFFLESKQEVKRVVWPTRDETVRTTLLVFAMVFVVGLILWLLDMFLFWAVQLLMSQGIQ